jgi:hypothetical protein
MGNCNWKDSNSIGMARLEEYVSTLPRDMPVFDVGCGGGETTLMLRKHFTTVYGIDPAPACWDPLQVATPDFPTVNVTLEALEALEAQVAHNTSNPNDFILCLIWPAPTTLTGTSVTPSEAINLMNAGHDMEVTYDIDAVYALRPAYIVTIVELSGGAGGTKFLEWLQNPIIGPEQSSESATQTYRVVRKYISSLSKQMDRYENTLIILARDDIICDTIPTIRVEHPESVLCSFDMGSMLRSMTQK